MSNINDPIGETFSQNARGESVRKINERAMRDPKVRALLNQAVKIHNELFCCSKIGTGLGQSGHSCEMPVCSEVMIKDDDHP